MAGHYFTKIYLRSSALSNLYIREDYDILSYMSDLGGLFEIAYLSGKLMTALLVSKMFQAKLIQAAYKIQYHF